MLFKIINPSDPYTLESSSLDVAVMTSVVLGQGSYSFKSMDGGEDIPSFVFGVKADDWCQEHFKESLMEVSNRVMDTKLREVVHCLDSVLYGDEQDRVDFLASVEGSTREIFEITRAARQENKCSSLNDIGARAYRMAEKLRQSIEEGMKTLQ